MVTSLCPSCPIREQSAFIQKVQSTPWMAPMLSPDLQYSQCIRLASLSARDPETSGDHCSMLAQITIVPHSTMRKVTGSAAGRQKIPKPHSTQNPPPHPAHPAGPTDCSPTEQGQKKKHCTMISNHTTTSIAQADPLTHHYKVPAPREQSDAASEPPSSHHIHRAPRRHIR